VTKLVKVEPFRNAIKKTFFPEVDSSDDLPKEDSGSEEEEPVICPRTLKLGKQLSNQVSGDSSESNDEGEDKSPKHPVHCPVTKTGAFTDLLRIRQMSEEEFD